MQNLSRLKKSNFAFYLIFADKNLAGEQGNAFQSLHFNLRNMKIMVERHRTPIYAAKKSIMASIFIVSFIPSKKG